MFQRLLFFFSIPIPPQTCGTSQLGDIWTNVLGLSRTTFVQAFLLDLISFENKQKHGIHILLKGNYCFSCLVVLQSQVTCVTLSFNSYVLLQQMMKCVFVRVCLCLTVDSKDIIERREGREKQLARFLVTEIKGRDRNSALFHYLLSLVNACHSPPAYFTPSYPHFTWQQGSLTPRHPAKPPAKTNELNLFPLPCFCQI